MIETIGLQIFRNIGINQPDLATARIRVGFGDGGLALPKRFDFGAGQCKSGLKDLVDKIIETRLAIVGDHAKLSLRTRRRLRRHRSPSAACVRQRALSRSRISVSNCTSLDGGAGVAGASGAFKRLMPLMHRNSTHAMIKKLMTSVIKFPHANTAPCFFASTKAGAVTFDDSGTK